MKNIQEANSKKYFLYSFPCSFLRLRPIKNNKEGEWIADYHRLKATENSAQILPYQFFCNSFTRVFPSSVTVPVQ